MLGVLGEKKEKENKKRRRGGMILVCEWENKLGLKRIESAKQRA